MKRDGSSRRWRGGARRPTGSGRRLRATILLASAAAGAGCSGVVGVGSRPLPAPPEAVVEWLEAGAPGCAAPLGFWVWQGRVLQEAEATDVEIGP